MFQAAKLHNRLAASDIFLSNTHTKLKLKNFVDILNFHAHAIVFEF